jgi:hypothetical protein
MAIGSMGLATGCLLLMLCGCAARGLPGLPGLQGIQGLQGPTGHGQPVTVNVYCGCNKEHTCVRQ